MQVIEGWNPDEDITLDGGSIRTTGLLWAINALFLHPLGLSLVVSECPKCVSSTHLSLKVAADGEWHFPAEVNDRRVQEFAEWYQTLADERMTDGGPHTPAAWDELIRIVRSGIPIVSQGG